ncbi:MAG TPA: helix-turn-helix transcriptional regulator, partial [Clostridiales bacterium]|nr:helix-turn-helix transcriptional regulator [Clostridiales bacterium]
AARMHLAAVFLAQGKEGELADCLKGTERFIDEDAGFLRPNYLAFTTRAKLWNGDASAAREWLDQYFVNDSAMLEPYRIYQYFTTVRAYAALSELDKARDLAERLRKMGQDFRRPQDAAEAGALLAAILWAKGQKKEAQETLEAVLLEIQPLGFVRLIADEGAAVLPILKKIKARVAHADYAAGLKENYVNNIYLAAYGVSKQRAGILIGERAKPVKLSKQQKVMLELLSQGYSRDGIVKETGLAVTTIKSHVKMLYEKLDVNSAADAVLRARELGIIE